MYPHLKSNDTTKQKGLKLVVRSLTQTNRALREKGKPQRPQRKRRE